MAIAHSSILTSLENIVAATTLSSNGDSSFQGWCLEALAGRFVELTGNGTSARLSVAAGLLRDAQEQGRLTAWIGGPASTFFATDFAAAGIDLRALPVMRVDEAHTWRVADTLLRSGAFGVVVVDSRSNIMPPLAIQTRLTGLAQKHHALLLALTLQTGRGGPRSSLVSLRAESEKRRAGHDCFVCDVRVVKDKRGVPGWTHEGMYGGTDGVC